MVAELNIWLGTPPNRRAGTMRMEAHRYGHPPYLFFWTDPNTGLTVAGTWRWLHGSSSGHWNDYMIDLTPHGRSTPVALYGDPFTDTCPWNGSQPEPNKPWFAATPGNSPHPLEPPKSPVGPHNKWGYGWDGQPDDMIWRTHWHRP